MAVMMNLPLIVKILLPPLLLLDFMRRFIHKQFILKICQCYHAACRPACRPFFEEMRDSLSRRRNPTVLEYGSGPFPALEAYPPGTHLIAVDPCPDFDTRLQEAWQKSDLARTGKLTLFTRKMEDVTPSMVPDNSVDAVFSRCANCSVSSNEVTFKNVHRILKPGGRYYFWDHVQSDVWYMKLIQYLMSSAPISLFTDCTLVRKPWEKLKAAGFTDVKVNRFTAPLPGLIFKPYTPTASGYAVK